MEIHATTTYDYELTRDYMRYIMFRNPRTNRGDYSILFFGFILTLIGLLLLSTSSPIEVARFTLIIAVLIMASCVTRYSLLPKYVFKNNPSYQNSENSFVIKERVVSLMTRNPLISGNIEISYSALFKVCETSEDFYFFIKPNQAYILRKSGIIDGTPEKVRDVLMKNTPKNKYYITK